MPPAPRRQQSASNLQCSVCNRAYTKKEHLQRHERSHTGDKPFACQTCGRSFARQDALNRHLRLHQRRSSEVDSVSHTDPTMFTPQNVEAGQFQVHPEEMLISPLPSGDSFSQSHLTSSTLFWPDSEGLLQNIMSIDPALWEQPMTLMPSALTSQASPDPMFSSTTPSRGGDEGHRAIQTLSAQLSSTLTGVTAPEALADLTSRFLDSCLHMFFSTFIPMLPVIHKPTFVFRQCSPPLLLNAIAIGSLFLGTKEASAKGDALWRLAHTAVATSWHSMITHKGEFDGTPGLQLVQTSLLSQIYAALAKSRTLRMTSQVFHGLGFYWARYSGLFDLQAAPPLPSPDDVPDVKYRAWRIWLARETRLRSLLGLYILDGVISQYSGNPTFAQHMSNQLQMPSDENVFNASTPDEWLQRVNEAKSLPGNLRFCDIFRKFFYPEDGMMSVNSIDLTYFSLKVILEGLKSLVAESRRIEPRPVGVPSELEIDQALDRTRQYIQSSQTLSITEKQTAMLRWHAICLDALIVTARGARRLCWNHGIVQHIFGGGERFETDIYPERHIHKEESRRTLLHAREIQSIASTLPLGLAHDSHVPGAVFAATTTYAAFTLAGRLRIPFPNAIDWATVVLLPNTDKEPIAMHWGAEKPDSIAETTAAFIRGTIGTGPTGNTSLVDLSYELSSMRILLRGLSLQWGVCIEMEEVVDAWLAKCT